MRIELSLFRKLSNLISDVFVDLVPMDQAPVHLLKHFDCLVYSLLEGFYAASKLSQVMGLLEIVADFDLHW